MDWKTCLETIFKMEQCPLEQETYGLYGVTITDKDVGLVIDVNEAGVKVSQEDPEQIKNVNVGVKISSSDLAGVLKVPTIPSHPMVSVFELFQGSLPPLQAYLTGRISTNGDIRKLMLFEKISERAHKPGATFSL